MTPFRDLQLPKFTKPTTVNPIIHADITLLENHDSHKIKMETLNSAKTLKKNEVYFLEPKSNKGYSKVEDIPPKNFERVEDKVSLIIIHKDSVQAQFPPSISMMFSFFLDPKKFVIPPSIDYSTWTLPKIQNKLESFGLDKKGNKAVLIKRLKEYEKKSIESKEDVTETEPEKPTGKTKKRNFGELKENKVQKKKRKYTIKTRIQRRRS